MEWQILGGKLADACAMMTRGVSEVRRQRGADVRCQRGANFRRQRGANLKILLEKNIPFYRSVV